MLHCSRLIWSRGKNLEPDWFSQIIFTLPGVTLQIRGECVDDFICQAQDRTKNAHAKSVAAAFNVWREMLQSDQITFESDRISILE